MKFIIGYKSRESLPVQEDVAKLDDITDISCVNENDPTHYFYATGNFDSIVYLSDKYHGFVTTDMANDEFFKGKYNDKGELISSTKIRKDTHVLLVDKIAFDEAALSCSVNSNTESDGATEDITRIIEEAQENLGDTLEEQENISDNQDHFKAFCWGFVLAALLTSLICAIF